MSGGWRSQSVAEGSYIGSPTNTLFCSCRKTVHPLRECCRRGRKQATGAALLFRVALDLCSGTCKARYVASRLQVPLERTLPFPVSLGSVKSHRAYTPRHPEPPYVMQYSSLSSDEGPYPNPPVVNVGLADAARLACEGVPQRRKKSRDQSEAKQGMTRHTGAGENLG